MIELQHITKIYPMGTTEVRALNGVSLHIAEREFVAIIGASGSGKSTLMHLLGCLDRPTSGRYDLLGETVSGLSDRQLARIRNRSIGFVFQTFNLISRMSAWENVAVPLFYARETVTKPRAMAALDRVGLADRADHQSNELSGGERQRVAIARAIVNSPRLILADEPTGNLDTRTGEQIMQIFHDLHAAGTTIILVTHEADIAEQALRIVATRDGKIIDDRSSPRTQHPGGASAPQAPAVEVIHTAAADAPDRGAPAAEAAGEPDDAEPAEAVRPPVVHPNAKRALVWALAGPVCMAALGGWAVLGKALLAVNPMFAKTAGRVISLALLAMIIVCPILGLVNGQKGARWAKLAPARFTGRRRARVAQWISGIYLVLLGCLVLLLVLAYVFRAQLQGGAG